MGKNIIGESTQNIMGKPTDHIDIENFKRVGEDIGESLGGETGRVVGGAIGTAVAYLTIWILK